MTRRFLAVAAMALLGLGAPFLCPQAYAVGGQHSTARLGWCYLSPAERACICLYIQCYPQEVQDKLKEYKGDAAPPPGSNTWKNKGKICKARPKTKEASKASAVTEWNKSTGKLTGVSFFDSFFKGDAVVKKSTVWQEGNRLIMGGFYPIPDGVGFGINGSVTACRAQVYAAVDDGLTEARDAASRSTFGSVTDPGPDANGNDNINADQWADNVDANLDDAEEALARAKEAKKKAQAKRDKIKAGGHNTTGEDKAIKHLCWEIARAEAMVQAARAAQGG